MNMDKINKWLTLVANIGVLVGIIFLSLEINQSNRIAERDARSESVAQEFELQKSFIKNAEVSALMLKLSSGETDLTPLEEFQAESFAQLLALRAADLNIIYEGGFLTEETLQRQIRGITLNIRRISGIVPYMENTMKELDLYGEASVRYLT
ncbi:MAG: hypothetical protein O2971_13690 [Proteobacteria bacterium]|nr:hypothetical protein [Pseudomonadota bacterium]